MSRPRKVHKQPKAVVSDPAVQVCQGFKDYSFKLSNGETGSCTSLAKEFNKSHYGSYPNKDYILNKMIIDGRSACRFAYASSDKYGNKMEKVCGEEVFSLCQKNTWEEYLGCYTFDPREIIPSYSLSIDGGVSVYDTKPKPEDMIDSYSQLQFALPKLFYQSPDNGFGVGLLLKVGLTITSKSPNCKQSGESHLSYTFGGGTRLSKTLIPNHPNILMFFADGNISASLGYEKGVLWGVGAGFGFFRRLFNINSNFSCLNNPANEGCSIYVGGGIDFGFLLSGFHRL